MLATEDVIEREFGAYKDIQDHYPGYIRIYKVFFNVKILKIFPKKKIKFIDIIRKNEYSLF